MEEGYHCEKGGGSELCEREYCAGRREKAMDRAADLILRKI